ncbi:MAG: xanthine dehydrogenase family protein molybdopterin-binding subunit [Pedobacter sp.]|nr:MAG: xanthine dehydrogenase family protein molybdopterin-binding subunit [Pedobacter sp.]
MQKVAKNAGWGKKLPAGKGMGFAVHYSFFSYVAQVVEVTVKGDDIKVDKVYCVIDCGTALNKDAVTAQMEGGIIFGLSLAKYGKITATNGIVDQTNFSEYQLARMNDAPEIHVEIIDIEDSPTGVGEPGVPPFAPAMISAIHAATGKWHTDLPLVQV